MTTNEEALKHLHQAMNLTTDKAAMAYIAYAMASLDFAISLQPVTDRQQQVKSWLNTARDIVS